jgi:hypothetical protein
VQEQNGLRRSVLDANPLGSFSSSIQKEKSSERERQLQQIIFDESIEIGCDWLEATGKPISETELQNLYDNGYSSYSPDEILGIFDDWEDYQTLSGSYHEDRPTPDEAKQQLVNQLREEAKQGLVPKVFFDETETYKVKNPSGKKDLMRYRFTGKAASPDTILLRYHKYLVVDHLTKDRESGQDITEERKTNIALGFTEETGKPLSSFYASLKNSVTSLTEQQLNLAIEELDAYDYIYPNSRKEHLGLLLENGRRHPINEPEYFYNPSKKKIILLGHSALHMIHEPKTRKYLDWLKSRGQVVFTENTTSLKRDKEKQAVLPLSSLLTNREISINRESDQRNKYRDFDRDLYLSYGHFLLNITNDISGFLIERGRDLNIGPGPWLIKSNYGSLPDFFEEVGVKKKQDLSVWTSELIEDYVCCVHEEYGSVDIALIRKLYQESPHNRPSVHAIQKSVTGGLTTILTNLELPAPPTKQRDPNELLLSAVEMAKTLGRIPKTKELSKIASTITFQKLFGSISDCQEQIRLELESEKLKLAA